MIVFLMILLTMMTAAHAGELDDLQLKTTTKTFNLFAFRTNSLSLFHEDKNLTRPVKRMTNLKAGNYLKSTGIGVLEDIRLEETYVTTGKLQLIIRWQDVLGKIERVEKDRIEAVIEAGEVIVYWNPAHDFKLGDTVKFGDETFSKDLILLMKGTVTGGEWVLFDFEHGWGRQLVLHVKVNVLNGRILEDQLRDLSFLASQGRLYAFIQDTCNPLNFYVDEEEGLKVYGEGSMGLKLDCHDNVCAFCMFPVYSAPVIIHLDRFDYYDVSQPNPVPEPETFLLVGMGLVGVLVMKKARRGSKSQRRALGGR